MTKKFRPKQCPQCRSNNENFACMNAFTYTLPGDLAQRKQVDWSPFKGETDRKCNRFTEKEAE